MSDAVHATAQTAATAETLASVRRQVVAAVAALFLIYCTSFNVLPRGDSYLAVPTAASIVTDRDLGLEEYLDVEAVASHYGLVSHQGRPVDFFPWLNSVAAVPVVVLVELAASVGPSPSIDELIESDRAWIVQLVTASLVSALGGVVIALLGFHLLASLGTKFDMPPSRNCRWPGRLVGRYPIVAMSLAVGLTTPLWSVTSRALWQHGTSILFVSTALLAVARARGPLTAGFAGFLAAAAFWVRPTNVVAAAAVLALAWCWQRRWLIHVMAGLLLFSAVVVLLDLIWLGTPLPPYFDAGRVGPHPELLDAVAANLISPARGLLIFCPQLLLAAVLLRRSVWTRLAISHRQFVAVATVATVTYLAIVSSYGYQWWAGHTYGPRFMIETLPFLVPLALVGSNLLWTSVVGAAERPRRLLVAGAWVVAAILHWQGAWFHSTQCWNGNGADIDLEPSRVFDLGAPQLTSGFHALVDEGPTKALWSACDETG